MTEIAKSFAVAVALAALCSAPAYAAASKCSSAKLKEAGKKAAGKAGCSAKAVAKANPVDSECIQKAEGKYVAGWANAESKGDCLSTGDETAIEAKVDAFVAELNSSLGGPGPSKCTSAKIKTAGKKAAAKTKCHSKAVAKDLAVDTACLQKAEDKFSTAFGKAEGKGDCISGNGDAAAIEADVDAFVVDLLAELTPSATTTTTSTTPVTTTTSTTIGGGVCGNGTQEPGESCDDGNTSNNDACPSNCVIAACSPISGSDRQVNVNFTPPVGVGVAGITVLVNYPEGKVSIPGSGNGIPAGIITNTPAGASSNSNDFDHALRQVVVNASNMPPGLLFRIHFENCTSAPAPVAGDFTCTVLDASDQNGNDVTGVTCTAIP